MRLAFVTINGNSWGGSEILWTQTAMKALENKHQVLISVFDWENQSDWIRKLEKAGATMIYRRKFYPATAERVRKKILNFFLPDGKKYTYHQYLINYNADRIFFNLGGGDEIANDNSDLMVFVRQTRIPYFIFCHSISFSPIASDLLAQNMIECYAKARKVFFTSKMQIVEVEKQLNHRFNNFDILSHPINQNFKQPIDFPESKSASIAMIGSLQKAWKGQDIAIRIFSKQEWKHRNWKLNIYGEGSDKQFLQELVEENDLQEKVIFHGIENDHKKIWKENQLLLIASQQDSGPITVFEAMNAGRPVVSTQMGAVPDFIENGTNGIVAEGTSLEALSNALEIAWQKQGEWKHWGENGFHILKLKYDFDSPQTLLNILIND